MYHFACLPYSSRVTMFRVVIFLYIDLRCNIFMQIMLVLSQFLLRQIGHLSLLLKIIGYIPIINQTIIYSWRIIIFYGS